MWIIADQIVLDSLQEYLLVGQVCFNLSTAFLEDLRHDLCSELVCRVGKDVGHLQNYAVEELWTFLELHR